LKLNLPRYTYSEVGRIANNFLKEHHPSLEIPIPIEEILDLKMGFNIFPFPRLFKDFGLNGFLSADMSTIYVDEVQYDQYNEKYRYTLAHELGHYVLQKSVYENLPYKSFDVNPPVIEAQIRKDNITQKIPIRRKEL